jgi:hypothetical protein
MLRASGPEPICGRLRNFPDPIVCRRVREARLYGYAYRLGKLICRM